MADEQDQSSKTEDPTGRRLEQAQERGNIAQSREVGHWLVMATALVALAMFAAPIGRRLKGQILPYIERPETFAIDGGGLGRVLYAVSTEVALSVGPVLALLLAVGVGASLAQNPPQLAWERLMPDISRLSPLAGMKRLFGMSQLVEFAKSVAKLVAVGSLAAWLIWPQTRAMIGLIEGGPQSVLDRVREATQTMLIAALAIMGAVAAGDVLYQKLHHLRQLRMTRQEVKDEFRQTEGDPIVKSRLRSLRMERARRRMMAAVPKADVVITNPTHYAVALKYDEATMSAPTVVAKGMDEIARAIRELAEEHKVPLVQNPPLAQALYLVDVDREIPPEHYQAVAGVISYVMRLKGKTRPRPAQPGRQTLTPGGGSSRPPSP
jgi:flagellar biosynthetic protein FlhB